MNANVLCIAGAQTPDQIDLKVVRLCFQAFLPDASRRFTRVISPIISQPIIDKSEFACGDLQILVIDNYGLLS